MTLFMRDKEQQRIGDLRRCVSVVRALKDEVNYNIIIKAVNLGKNIVDNIITLIEENPDLTDEEIAEKIISEEEL